MAKKSDYPVFEPFNPLDKRHLGASVANALLESDIYPLPPEPFIGALFIMLAIFLPTRSWQMFAATTSTLVRFM